MENPAAAAALRVTVSPFVRSQGVDNGFVLQALPGGANNRVYRLRAENCDRALKVYFQNPADPRDRFGAERAFYEHLWRAGVRRSPEPIGWDETSRLGLFSFVDGRKLRADEVDADAVRQALDFIIEANQVRPAQAALPVASEACFSLAEHLAMVKQRVVRLQQIEPQAEVDAQAAAVVREELNPAWETVRVATTAPAGKNLGDVLPAAARWVSPSDFGFHNALLSGDGRLRFFDFEYAGWDDPAKLCCDFFCQPQLPVALAHWDLFVGGLAQALGAGDALAARGRRLLPVYQLKWCCIMLNVFLRGEQVRREFALGGAVPVEHKRAQLDKVRAALRQIAQV